MLLNVEYSEKQKGRNNKSLNNNSEEVVVEEERGKNEVYNYAEQGMESLETSGVFVLALVKKASDVKESILHKLMAYNCIGKYHLRIMLPPEEVKYFYKILSHASKKAQISQSCGSVKIMREPFWLTLRARIKKYRNKFRRVEHLGLLRDSVRDLFLSELRRTSVLDIAKAFIIVIDLDLESIPPMKKIREEIISLRESREHVACSLGEMGAPFGYYDIFATILLPSTFLYPIQERELSYSHTDEERSIIRSNSAYGYFQQGDINEMILKKSFNGSFPVRSCFGGLAIYKGSAFGEKSCVYNAYQADLRRYAVRNAGVCEHVVFHECLRKFIPDFRISIRTEMKTEWKSVLDYETDRMTSSGMDFIVTRSIHKEFMKYEKNHRLVSKQKQASLQVTLQCNIAITTELGFNEIVHQRNFRYGIVNQECRQIFAALLKISNEGRLSCYVDCENMHGYSDQIKIWDTKKLKGSRKGTYAALLRPSGEFVVIDENTGNEIQKIL